MIKKVILFDQLSRLFIKSLTAYPGPKELFCDNPKDAYDFKSPEKAQEWVNQSGFSSLSILELIG